MSEVAITVPAAVDSVDRLVIAATDARTVVGRVGCTSSAVLPGWHAIMCWSEE